MHVLAVRLWISVLKISDKLIVLSSIIIFAELAGHFLFSFVSDHAYKFAIKKNSQESSVRSKELVVKGSSCFDPKHPIFVVPPSVSLIGAHIPGSRRSSISFRMVVTYQLTKPILKYIAVAVIISFQNFFFTVFPSQQLIVIL
jgi:hypothetical protein